MNNKLLLSVLNADLKEIDLFCFKIKEFMKKNNISQYYFDTQLLLREVFNNAVVHGSKSNPNKKIITEFSYINNLLKIDIKDEGYGFDWRKVLKKKINIADSHGRGLAIIEQYADEIIYNEKGNKVTLKKKILTEENMNELNITRDDNRIYLPLNYDLVASNLKELREELLVLIKDNVNEITIDFNGVEMVDSLGIGLLVQIQNSLTEIDGRLIVKNLSTDILNLFKSMRLNHHFTIEEN